MGFEMHPFYDSFLLLSLQVGNRAVGASTVVVEATIDDIQKSRMKLKKKGKKKPTTERWREWWWVDAGEERGTISSDQDLQIECRHLQPHFLQWFRSANRDCHLIFLQMSAAIFIGGGVGFRWKGSPDMDQRPSSSWQWKIGGWLKNVDGRSEEEEEARFYDF
ncbi:hypothetical protein L1987_26675 [Smallanthus sonchifolius]|uniref:Uncharacterized protein n=1 Tax=Smallanthus sonchifolius TaxID=185202 RepID=A0ACB9IBE4_9ASTR|nr:hypothetical protein L1987_26675 [Smallanthus sonchifolius]